MAAEHALLAGIRAAIETAGTHSYHWGALRREVFPGESSWLGLKAWCDENAMECELAYTQSSKNAEVQFRKRRASAPAQSSPLPSPLPASGERAQDGAA